jgi:hypothetical protein
MFMKSFFLAGLAFANSTVWPQQSYRGPRPNEQLPDCIVRSDADESSGMNGLYLGEEKVLALLSDVTSNETVPRALAALIYEAKRLNASGLCKRIKIEAFNEDLVRAMKFVEAREQRDRTETARKRFIIWKSKYFAS